jgi:hypothetical protein
VTVRPRIPLAMLTLLLLCCSGCTPRYQGPQVTDFSYRTDPRAHNPGLIAVLPAFADAGIGKSAQALDLALPAALREQGGHEVIALDRNHAPGLYTRLPASLHDVTPEELRRLRDATGANAVVVTWIDHYVSFDPIQIGLRSYMVSLSDGTTLWSASGHFDGSRRDIQRDLEIWWKQTRGQANANLAGWRIALSSPSHYLRYVSDRLAASVLW